MPSQHQKYKTSLSPPRPLRLTVKKILSNAKRVAVVGIGSELRGDDMAGVLIVQRLREKLSEAELKIMCPIVGGAAPENITGEVAQFEPSHVIMVDAADIQLQPGQGRPIPPEEIGGVTFSTHMLPISIIIAYLQERLPQTEFFALGLQPKGTELMAAPSPEILAAVDEIVAALKDKATEIVAAG